MEYNKYNTNTEKEIKDFVFRKKNIKNKSSNNISVLQNKILELEKKLEFYKKYEDNLNTNDLTLINKTADVLEHIIHNLDKNFIIKGQFSRIKSTSNSNTNIKQIEFEF